MLAYAEIPADGAAQRSDKQAARVYGAAQRSDKQAARVYVNTTDILASEVCINWHILVLYV